MFLAFSHTLPPGGKRGAGSRCLSAFAAWRSLERPISFRRWPWMLAKTCAVACARRSSASLAAGGVRSHCRTGSWPYMQKNGDTPVVSEAWLLAAGSARGSQADQSTRARKHCSVTAFMHSVRPSDSGWDAVVRSRSIPSRLHSRCQNTAANWAHGPKTSSRENRGSGRHGGQISRPDWRRPGAEG